MPPLCFAMYNIIVSIVAEMIISLTSDLFWLNVLTHYHSNALYGMSDQIK